jgi:hypothetical protein
LNIVFHRMSFSSRYVARSTAFVVGRGRINSVRIEPAPAYSRLAQILYLLYQGRLHPARVVTAKS